MVFLNGAKCSVKKKHLVMTLNFKERLLNPCTQPKPGAFSPKVFKSSLAWFSSSGSRKTLAPRMP